MQMYTWTVNQPRNIYTFVLYKSVDVDLHTYCKKVKTYMYICTTESKDVDLRMLCKKADVDVHMYRKRAKTQIYVSPENGQ